MGSLFSRAYGGSPAAEGGAELTSEVKVVARASSTPGTPRAAPPLSSQRWLWPPPLRRSPPPRASPVLTRLPRVLAEP
jgi:hypothetical protein